VRPLVAGLGFNVVYVSLGLAVGAVFLVAANLYNPDGPIAEAFFLVLSFSLTLVFSALAGAVVLALAYPLVLSLSRALIGYSVTATAWICFGAGTAVAELLVGANAYLSALVTASWFFDPDATLGSPSTMLARVAAVLIAGICSAMAYLTVARTGKKRDA
jgi:hypothetical protein